MCSCLSGGRRMQQYNCVQQKPAAEGSECPTRRLQPASGTEHVLQTLRLDTRPRWNRYLELISAAATQTVALRPEESVPAGLLCVPGAL